MGENRAVLSESEIKRRATEFIAKKYWGARVSLKKAELTDEGSIPVYHLKGSLQVASRSAVSRFVCAPTEYTLDIKMDATNGKVLGYEMN